MASDPSFVSYVMDQLHEVEGFSCRKMFGEYALFKDAKVVALICDNQLFVKPTSAGREFIGAPVEACAYKGTKPSFLVQNLDDRDWLNRLLKLTADALPQPKAKKTKTVNRK